ncbi:MAG: hypothetical protein CVU97_07490 [Firmicutes bacterium HGW-Firmicutes-21]|nr:MAG: hypothetical protein CVU97_07490 [Firmicutes bacterium HGW-Firmicutes-21]
MKPIEKNIIVIDKQGNSYGATYPKRAKGLVKNGRARFVNEKTICLACPPNKILEDNKMNDNINENIPADETGNKTMEMRYVLEQIERVLNNTSHITEALKELTLIPDTQGISDISGQAKAYSIADIVRTRETTNQQLLKLYEKMYDDLKPKEMSIKEKALEIVNRTLNNPTCSDTEKEMLSDVLATIKHLCNW